MRKGHPPANTAPACLAATSTRRGHVCGSSPRPSCTDPARHRHRRGTRGSLAPSFWGSEGAQMPKGPRIHPQTPLDQATGKGCVPPNSPSRPQNPPGSCLDKLISSGSFAPKQNHSPTHHRALLQRPTQPHPSLPRPPSPAASTNLSHGPGGNHVPRSANGAGA